MNYQKIIAYIDYLESGVKIKNVGFVRIEVTDQKVKVGLKINGLRGTDSGKYEVCTERGEMIGNLSLENGKGCFEESPDALDATGIRIRLPGARLLQANWKERVCVGKKEEQSSQVEESNQREANYLQEDSIWQEAKVIEEDPVWQEVSAIKKDPLLQAEESVKEDSPLQEAELSKEDDDQMEAEPQMPEIKIPKGGMTWGEISEDYRVYASKWEQLEHLFSMVHPFEDERAFLSITPRDFVVLREEHQKLVHNSFLLHGFYNYRHILLGKIKEKDKENYYIGVPGNFYAREKMVAQMFGFEGFESKKTPAEPGAFGYYMKRVEI